MLAKSFFWAWLAASGTASAPASQPPTAVASPALTEEQLVSELVARLVKVCEANPEVERAFVLVRSGSDGSPIYTFVPIFDRKVSDKAIAEADAAYKELFPTKGYLPLMLLARHTWKKSLAGVPPIYVRPEK